MTQPQEPVVLVVVELEELGHLLLRQRQEQLIPAVVEAV
jgi:hypothetical protein